MIDKLKLHQEAQGGHQIIQDCYISFDHLLIILIPCTQILSQSCYFVSLHFHLVICFLNVQGVPKNLCPVCAAAVKEP